VLAIEPNGNYDVPALHSVPVHWHGVLRSHGPTTARI
jgi:hypothetical protein